MTITIAGWLVAAFLAACCWVAFRNRPRGGASRLFRVPKDGKPRVTFRVVEYPHVMGPARYAAHLDNGYASPYLTVTQAHDWAFEHGGTDPV